MKCVEYLAEYSRCKRGVPVARLFRHYFCEGNHKGCPLKKVKTVARHGAAYQPESLFIIRGEV